MSDRSKIEWTDATWNPVRGCEKVSEGCRNCYAARVAARFSGEGMPYEGLAEMTPHGPRWTGKIRYVMDTLDQPLKWRKPRRIFVNSMSDLFHQDVPDWFIFEVFDVMYRARWHTFQILTKRPERMWEWVTWYYEKSGIERDVYPNVWLGVSVENQKVADERIPLLLQTPAAVRFLSCEPLLGPVDLSEWLQPVGWWCPNCQRELDGTEVTYEETHDERFGGCGESVGGPPPLIDWVIVGGESGPGARPMHPDWVRSIRDQCQQAGVAFFFKQHGEWLEFQEATNPGRVPTSRLANAEMHTFEDGTEMLRVGKKAAGRLLDGRTWDELPVVNQ